MVAMTPVRVSETELDFQDINLADPDFWFHPEIDGALAKLRHERPITWHQHEDSGAGFWSVVRFADIATMTKQRDVFVNKYGIRVHHDHAAHIVRPGTNAMIEMDPPEQTRNRRIVSQGFTPKMVRRMEDYVRSRAQGIVADLAGAGEFDFVEHVAARLPMEIICDIMGVPEDDRPMMLALTNLTLGDQDADYGGTPKQGAEATRKLRDYGIELAKERRRSPGEDLISTIALADIDGDMLDDEELGGFFALLIAAGNETTRTAVSHGMHALTLFPDQRRLWLSDLVGLEEQAAEEIVRWATPLRHMGRVVEHDTVFNGIKMSAGDKVAMWYASANRDETVFDDPYTFDITRAPNPQGGFGTGGPHFCLGANLARREVWVMFQELLKIYPDIEAVSDPVPLRSVQVNGIKELQVALHGGGQ